MATDTQKCVTAQQVQVRTMLYFVHAPGIYRVCGKQLQANTVVAALSAIRQSESAVEAQGGIDDSACSATTSAGTHNVVFCAYTRYIQGV